MRCSLLIKGQNEWRVLLFCVISCVSTACSSITPQENFADFVQVNVGKKVGENQRHGMASNNFIQSRKLSNGKMELEYKDFRSCRLFFIVDPATNIVESWRSEGSTEDCALAP